MTRHDALIRVIDALHAEIAALKANDVAGLERATREKLIGIEAVGAANVRRRLTALTGNDLPSYRSAVAGGYG